MPPRKPTPAANPEIIDPELRPDGADRLDDDAAHYAARAVAAADALHLLLRAELPDSVEGEPAARVRQAQRDLNAAALRRLSPPTVDDAVASILGDPLVALGVHRAVASGRLRAATPWTGRDNRRTRDDGATGANLASVFRTDRGLYGASAFEVSPADGTMAEMMAWCDAQLAARGYTPG